MRFGFNTLSISDIQSSLDEFASNCDEITPSEKLDGFVEAAVLILLVLIDNLWHLVLTRRTDTVRDHKGQVAFPGGTREESDGSLVITALRETWEEIGIKPEQITVLGCLSSVETISHYIITPIVATTSWPQPLQLAKDEVERAFTVPLYWLADQTHWEYQTFRLPDSNQTRKTIQYREYDKEILWGISAMITQTLLERLTKHPVDQ
jgi:8-oxo-dGTP pyrophosphatase MutT (NUDIX family)